ncbi:hypothetical protein [Lysobacter enzymogenes]|uniref:hypothetical protein n=1 Tax=Lysobacter enzymogenes TaxID=69 RepID=UPI000899FE35|nr:hypothetical protein [Lysobacter enzymogenes]SDW93602.1 hypothetical protein SAMN05421681_103272 [Lysobacter enzymogenes]SDY08371.1 hypothetical protein SAMN05421681_110190 [Lysobacter enzymogenes]
MTERPSDRATVQEGTPEFLDRIAAELVQRDPGLHSNQIAASLRGRAIILRHVEKENRHERPL